MSTVWCTMSSYRLDKVLMVISPYKFCRCCAIQVGEISATSGRDCGFCITIMREPHTACCVAIPLREKRSCHQPTTVLSGSPSVWLVAVPYSENSPQGDMIRSHGEHRIESDGRTPEGSKEAFRRCL
jgi:hypothetical protein